MHPLLRPLALIALCLGGACAGDLDPWQATEPQGLSVHEAISLDAAADFHPETDRWTDRHNRIRLSLWAGGWVFTTDLDIEPTAAIGLQLAWEVPGFIGIRWDSGIAPFAQLDDDFGGTNDDDDGVVHAHTLSLGIFNPELSVGGLALWAGFGGGVFVHDFDEPTLGAGVVVDEEFDGLSFSANLFLELDYAIVDVVHLGIQLRQHVLFGDNPGGVSEATLHLSVVF